MVEKNTSRVLSFTTHLNSADDVSYRPVSETRVLWPQTAAIFATTPRPESSKLFMSWLLSDERQQQFIDNGSYLTRKDLKRQVGSVWMILTRLLLSLPFSLETVNLLSGGVFN
jgi:ABC-type Fe3+ transport system substrate-binding protein